jgi:hypothetical protein
MVQEKKAAENYKHAILNVVELVCMNLIKVVLVIRRDT